MLVLGVDRKENVVVGIANLAEGGYERGLVAIADIVLFAPGEIAAALLGNQLHIGRVDIGAVCPLGEAKREDPALLEESSGPLLDLFVLTHPDRAQAQHRDLPGVPICEPVEGQDFGEFAVAPGIPARICCPIARGCKRCGKEAFLLGVFEEVRVPDLLPIIALERALALGLKELDGLAHDLLGSAVGVGA